MAAYRHQRAQAPPTIEGQLELARWCGKRRLLEQQRAHLTRVLQIEPNQREARRLLGHRLVDGTWLSEEQMAEQAERALESAAAMREWKPRLEKILDGLAHRGQRQRRAAAERLEAIDDPAAVEPIEALLCTRGEEVALLALETIHRMAAPEAAVALARQAVFSPWETVRHTAAEKLRGREPSCFVPVLLSAMHSPVQSRAALYREPGGRLMYRHVFRREGQDQQEVAVLETEYRHTVLTAENPLELAASRSMLDEARRRDAAMKARLREMAVAQHNFRQRQFNERIAGVLAKATGEDLPASPEAWWKWWNDYNEVFTVGKKPVQSVYRREQVAFDDPYADEPSSTPDGPGSSQKPTGSGFGSTPDYRLTFECLVAGTPVWTESGFRPIEQIRVGDLVLAQDPQSGELAYKPVLRTTVRPPEHLVEFRAGEEPIRASGGHPFWVAGRGWVKARKLQAGMPLHGLNGVTRAGAPIQTGFEKTYNLIVADFHTYFAGRAMILTHDNTIRQPARAAVPGLAQD
jgi:hypothetical protein